MSGRNGNGGSIRSDTMAARLVRKWGLDRALSVALDTAGRSQGKARAFWEQVATIIAEKVVHDEVQAIAREERRRKR